MRTGETNHGGKFAEIFFFTFCCFLFCFVLFCFVVVLLFFVLFWGVLFSMTKTQIQAGEVSLSIFIHDLV